MARMARIPPTTRRLTFDVTAAQSEGFIDIAQCLSLLNRKAYRQGMEYYVDSWTLTSEVPARFSMAYISQSWVNTNSWVKAFHTWMESQEQLTDFEDVKGRYHDFKVFMLEAHAQLGVADNFIPVSINPAGIALVSATASASWDASEIVMPNDGGVGITVSYLMHMLGNDAVVFNSKGIVSGYADSRSRPQLDDPNVVEGTSWMSKAFDTGDNLDIIADDVQDKNDAPPYFVDEDTAEEFYVGGANSAVAGSGFDLTPVLALNPAVGSWATKHGAGFVAPCGLIMFANEAESDCVLHINLAVGPYKGIMARPMQDVN